MGAVLGLLLLNLAAAGAVGQTTSGHLTTDFGVVPVGTTVTRAILTLTPGADRVVDSVSVTGPNSGEFVVQAGGCGAGSTITAGSSCTVSVSFTPSAGGCRQALVRVASRDVATNQTFLDVAGLIGAGGTAAPAGTVPLELPMNTRLQGSPTFTPITGTPESTFSFSPAVLASRGGLTQSTVSGTLVTANAGTPVRSVAFNTHTYSGLRLHGTGQDTLVICAIATVLPGPAGFPIIEEIWYVASGTGRYAGATGGGRTVHTFTPEGVQIADVTGTITLQIPTGPFAYIYLADLLRGY